MKKLLSSLRSDLVLVLLSALLAALSLRISSLFSLSYLALVPLFYAILKPYGRRSLIRAFLLGFGFGFFFLAFCLNWFCELYPLSFTGISKGAALAVVLLGWLGISFLHGLLYAIPTLLCHLASKRVSNRAFLLLVACFGFLTVAKITSLGELAFPWIRLSLGHYRAPVFLQVLSLFGTDGLDLWILGINALLTLALLEKNKKRILSLCLCGALFGANLILGLVRLYAPSERESLRVALVQGNLLSGEKWESGGGAYETYVSLTRSAAEYNPDLVVWPESAVPVNLYSNPSYLSDYQSLSEEIGAPILMGCFWKKDGAVTNSAILVDADGISEVYSKQHLVPFGEKVPYREIVSALFPALEQINMLSEDLAAGSGPVLLEGDRCDFGAVICFESVFPELCRQSVKNGAQMLAVVTNDSWYKDSAGVYQHLAHSVFRTVENGRAVVRCANSGVSVLISPEGVITEELGPLERGLVVGEAEKSENQTLYTRLGDVLYPLLLVSAAIFYLVLMIRERRVCREGKKGSDLH